MRQAHLVARVIVFVASLIGLASPVLAADDPPPPPEPKVVRVGTDGAKAVGEFVAIPSDTAGVLVLEEQSSFKPDQTEAILKRFLERRAVKAPTGVVTKRAESGNSLVALGADVLVLVGGAKLEGATEAWLRSAGEFPTAKLTTPLVQLLATEVVLPERFLRRDTALYFTPPTTFSNDRGPGAIVLAPKQATILLDKEKLDKIRKRVFSATTADDALKLLPKELEEYRSTLIERKKDPDEKKKAEEKPKPQRDPSEELARYPTSLRKLQESLEKFDPYYRGDIGEWKDTHPSLEAVWRAGNTNMTSDGDTKTTVGELQDTMRACCSDLMRICERTEKWTNGTHPHLSLLKRNDTTLSAFDKALDKNDCEKYEALRRAVLDLTSP